MVTFCSQTKFFQSHDDDDNDEDGDDGGKDDDGGDGDVCNLNLYLPFNAPCPLQN